MQRLSVSITQKVGELCIYRFFFAIALFPLQAMAIGEVVECGNGMGMLIA